jgi:hypothetical protein
MNAMTLIQAGSLEPVPGPSCAHARAVTYCSCVNWSFDRLKIMVRKYRWRKRKCWFSYDMLCAITSVYVLLPVPAKHGWQTDNKNNCNAKHCQNVFKCWYNIRRFKSLLAPVVRHLCNSRHLAVNWISSVHLTLEKNASVSFDSLI